MKLYHRRAPEGLDRRDDWRDFAACAGLGDLFLPRDERNASSAEQKRICAGCPVKTDCLNAAMKEEGSVDQFRRAGVRGGLTPTERAGLARYGYVPAPHPEEAKADAELSARQKAREQARQLLQEGRPDVEVAATTGLCRTTVGRIREGLGLPNSYHARTPQDAFNERAKPTGDGHMKWDGTNAVTINGRRYTASQLAFVVGYGREPDGSVMVTCGRLGCVDPSHLADQTMREQAKAVAA
ncbi:WhiB family transcriptional regulator [Streptomyces lunaelactis]|uniref:WhiB family transcriptional regulator n=1 Tax=Streptomyces lunaelactis TaxID=1535768 RepID=UPI001C30A583|nr:WhiB family transcriptional regulator [Streptomyces lunaelactis]